MTDYLFTDNHEKNRYELHAEGHIAFIDYIKTTTQEIHLTHTLVPSALEGKGIGSQLVSKALADIENKELKLAPLCPFIAGYIKKHPEWKKLLIKGFTID